ncbi:hypothetical protein CANARDRAFT_28396 [[Candida] arabinofermentans NRRL YB-2248]|uniref:Mitochondrial outer membrane transport complex Sam37/metaxin N-terminal domain-containing protein n=1 Tax=[Candida] arabinofermentans NRRL YB-2248 TaxID=983967 RepID=A0A1E4T1R7_9ASCO|nr:hypothetical protein CANARDRAFT_28396 [[Candida] arabinofermentans NRRL YB-2248]
MLQVYVWGDGLQVAEFDPESLAIAKFVNIYCSNLDLQLIPNSNYLLSNNGKLPLLITDKGTQIQGYKEITNYLSKNEKLDSSLQLDIESQLLNQGFMEFISETLQTLTAYNLFLNKENYEGYTRGIFKKYLPFPFQYKPPLDFKARAIEICNLSGISIDQGYSDVDSDEMKELNERERQIRETPVLSTVQKSQNDGILKNVLAQKNILTNMKGITLLQDTIKEFNSLKQSLSTEETEPNGNLFHGTKLSTSEILLYSYFESNTITDLKSDFVKSYLQNKEPELLIKTDQLSNDVGKGKVNVTNCKLSVLTALNTTIQSYI